MRLGTKAPHSQETTMSAIQFQSVRAINKAIHESAFGLNREGKYPRVLMPNGNALRIARARCDKQGFLYVRLLVEGDEQWVETLWENVVIR